MNRKSAVVSVAIFLLLLLAGCPASRLSGQKETDTAKGELMHFLGKVVYLPIEGGFFGILDENGKKYDPVNLPKEYRQDGLAVRIDAYRLPPSVGFHMWGEKIEIVNIIPL